MTYIKVGLGTCGISAGGEYVFNAIKKEINERNLSVILKETGCIGMCFGEVLVDVTTNGSRHLYARITPDKVKKIIEEHIIKNKPVEEWVVIRDAGDTRTSFFEKQKRIVLKRCGVIDPNSIDEYLEHDGYKAIRKAVQTMSGSEIIECLIKSGLRGRGGGGYLTGRKWQFTKNASGDKKYVVCNADEGDPGAFMDRSVLEGDPHSVLEGMMIAAFATGATGGYIYVRAEYPRAIEKLRNAIRQCEERGLLGSHILDSDFHFSISIKEGAGAFVCGEETALLASIEGKRGIPRIRPPFPAQKGLFGNPTNINNVETYANIPWIIVNGPDAFASLGTERSKGTKVFALAGKIKNSGLVEVPMGITINEIVFELGGGIKNNQGFKAVQMGGPSGGCIPASMGDLKIDYDEITTTGAIMGSGGMIVLDNTTCMVDVSKFFLTFTQNESCGKCTFCRIGTKRMLEILEKITAGSGEMSDLELLEDLAYKIKKSSLCGLGQTAPNPVLTTLRYFREEYIAHIKEKQCPAHLCPALIQYRINPDICTGCTLCKKQCPADAISGEPKIPHTINSEKCIKCELCYDACRAGAVEKI